MNKESRRYYGDIKSLIPSRGKYEKELLKNYKQQIQELNISNSNITYNELQDIIGHPKDIVSSYYEYVDTDYLIKRLRASRNIRLCANTALALIVTAFIVLVTLTTIDYINSIQATATFYNESSIHEE